MAANRRSALFEDHVRANEDDLARYFQRRLFNGADAAEAFGEFLLTAWKLRRRIPENSLEARMWLFATARNVLLNSRRSLARHSAAVQRLIDVMHVQDAVLPSDELSLELREALEGLPDDDAELVRLVYWDGLRSHEAAVVLGINPSTARSRLAKAKQCLRAVLDPDDERSPEGVGSVNGTRV
ncbi:RNA polymerase sigma factor [Plantibacter sp. YIM 135347]|uniref:RNA polymerase sigma factor n=1 Tax=Plantibacter sp. YIM 135347 TaxID=3423919 RepID=UPI003D338BC7